MIIKKFVLHIHQHNIFRDNIGRFFLKYKIDKEKRMIGFFNVNIIKFVLES